MGHAVRGVFPLVIYFGLTARNRSELAIIRLWDAFAKRMTGLVEMMLPSRQPAKGMRTFGVTLILLTGIGCQQVERDAPEHGTAIDHSVLSDASFASWRERILTKETELLWGKLPWLTTYADGLEHAAAKDKPLLLWAMNGHPLGCT